jgi:cytochrome c peroxidase
MDMRIRIDRASALVLLVLAGGAACSDDGPEGTPDAGVAPPDGGGEVSLLTADEQAFFQTTSPLPERPPADPTNAYADNTAAAALGQKWFFDKRFSGPVGAAGQGTVMPAPTTPPQEVVAAVGPAGTAGLVACVTCHSFDNGAAGDDRKSPNHVALGTGVHPRNSPPVVNSSYYEVVNWAGRFAAQWELPAPVVENPRIMNGSRIYLTQQIWKYYKSEYQAIFHEAEHGNDGGEALFAAVKGKIAAFNAAQPTPIAGDELAGATIPRGKPKANAMAPDGLWESLSMEEKGFVNRVLVNFGKSIAAYQRQLVSRNTPFDAWVSAGFKGSAIPLAAQRGAKVFIKAGCNDCHKGTMLTDFDFHNTGLTQRNSADSPPTEGAGVTPPDGSDMGRFSDGDALAKANGAGGATPGLSVDTKWSDDRTAGAALVARFGAVSPMPESVRGAFRTPSLRQVKDTAPYMHAGQLKTLREVVDFYDRGGDSTGFVGTKDVKMTPLALTEDEKNDLVAFMETLSGGDPISAALVRDTSSQ